ncbi:MULTISPECIES: hypothetical protein [Enterococcus]|uniref:hypothetical protein n=1 Tax=Enterococcus TaxID=1350 RepID=UPI001BCCB627|nr:MULTISPECIES: hypothetical protein [Enterococcus]
MSLLKVRKNFLLFLPILILFGCSNDNVAKDDKPNLGDGKDTVITYEKTKDNYEITPELEHVFSPLGSNNRGFDVKEYLNSDMGQWAINGLQNYISNVPQNDQQIIDYWANKGMAKHYFPGNEQVQEWAVYTPLDMDEAKKGSVAKF